MSTASASASAVYVKPRPEVRPGYTVRVHERIQEGNKERVQIFEGLVISVHKGALPTDTTFTVRRIASGIGVEKVFPLHSPKIEKIEVKKVAKVRRSKLFFLRGRRGKAARLSERFTTADEFAVAIPEEPEVVETPEEIVEEQETVETTESEAPAVDETPAEQAAPTSDDAPAQEAVASATEPEETPAEEEKKE